MFQSGVISSLPSLIGGIGGLICAAAAQWMKRKEFLNRINIYRLFNGIGKERNFSQESVHVVGRRAVV